MKLRPAHREISPDTFAGGVQLLTIMADPRGGLHAIEWRAFVCIPGPRIFPVSTAVPAGTGRWSRYPRDLLRLELRPDLGYGLNFIVGPILRKAEAWFGPHDNWQ